MSNVQLDLVESELKIILEALSEMESNMSNICAISKDEVADTGNDLIEVRLLLNSLKEKAIGKYGAGILNFSKELL